MDPIVFAPLHLALAVVWCTALLWLASRARVAHTPEGWTLSSSETRPPLGVEQARALQQVASPGMRRMVRTWVRRLGVPPRDRTDVVQIALLEAVRSVHKFDPALGRVNAWMNRIVVHATSHYHESAQHRLEEIGGVHWGKVVDPTETPDVQLQAHERGELFERALLSLEERERWLVLRHGLEEVSIAELAQERGLGVSTLYKKYAAAVARLSDLMVAMEARR